MTARSIRSRVRGRARGPGPAHLSRLLRRRPDGATAGRSARPGRSPKGGFPCARLHEASHSQPALPWRKVGLLVILAMLRGGDPCGCHFGTQRLPAPPFGLAANGVITYPADGDIYTRNLVSGRAPSHPRRVRRQTCRRSSRATVPKFAFIRIDPNQEGVRDDEGAGEPDGRQRRRQRPARRVCSARRSTNHGSGHPTASRSPSSRLGPHVAESYRSCPPTAGQPRLVSARSRAPQRRTAAPTGGSGADRQRSRPVGGRDSSPSRSTAAQFAGSPPPATTCSSRRAGCSPSPPMASKIVYEHPEQVMTLRILDIDTGEEHVFGENLPPVEGGGAHRRRSAGLGGREAAGLWSLVGCRLTPRSIHQMWTASLDGDGSDAAPVGRPFRNQGGVLPFVYTSSPDGTQIVVHRTGSSETWSTNLQGAGLQATRHRRFRVDRLAAPRALRRG